jgi:hypothetical protein
MMAQAVLAAQVMVWQDGLVEFWEDAGAQAQVAPKTPEVSNVPYHTISYHSFSFCGSVQGYKIHMDMEIAV